MNNKYQYLMLIIKIKEGENVDKALRRYKRKFEKTGVLREIRDRKEHKKPSERKRAQFLRAVYHEELRRNEEK